MFAFVDRIFKVQRRGLIFFVHQSSRIASCGFLSWIHVWISVESQPNALIAARRWKETYQTLSSDTVALWRRTRGVKWKGL
ncbi:unnamed protein product [Lathyrus oleraceus]